jgi:hypothetical protein
MPAANRKVDGDSVARLYEGNSFTDRLDDAGGLVTGDDSSGTVAAHDGVAVVETEIAATNRRGPDAHYDFANPCHWVWKCLDKHTLVTG